RHHDVAGTFDRVAVATHHDGLAWVTRGRGATDTLAYWEARGAGRATDTALPMPDADTVIPVAVATDLEGWTAVAVTRDRPDGHNTGLVAWASRSGSPPEAASLSLPDGDSTVPPRVRAGRSRGTTVIVAVADGAPVTWVHEGGAGGSWRTVQPDLGIDTDL